MKKLLTLGMAAALLALACAAHAYPTLAGSTGLIQAPTAMVAAPGTFDIAADYVASKNDDLNQKDSFPIRAQFGVGGGLEVGAGYDDNAFDGKGFWDVNAKYKLPYNFSGIQTAVGASYGQTSTLPDWGGTDLKVTQVYLVGTDHFNVGIPLGVTLGVNWTQFELADKNSGWRIQLGASAMIFKGLALVGDVQSIAKANDFNEKNLWSLGARYMCTPALSAEVGVTNGMYVGLAKRGNLFVGVNYALGSEKEK
jgi:hypothetical protein